LVLFSFDFT